MVLILATLVGLAVCIASGEWGVTLAVALAVGFLALCAAEERKSAEAWHNRREYWRKGGSER